MRTLIIEDSRVIQLLLKKLLEPYGIVNIANNGVDGVTAVHCALEAAVPYDLICLDIMMPLMNGHEALNHIRNMEQSDDYCDLKRAKIIMTTSVTDSKSVIAACNENCDCYVIKPFDRAKLLEKLRKLELIK